MSMPQMIQQFPRGMVYGVPVDEPLRRPAPVRAPAPTIAQRRAMLTAELAGLPPRSHKREKLLRQLQKLTLAELRGEVGGGR